MPTHSHNEHEYLPLSRLSGGTPYSAEYLSLLARKHKLSSRKIDNVWHSTRAIVEGYVKAQGARADMKNSTDELLPLTKLAPLTPYSAEYLSLRARKHKFGARKIDNVWYATKTDVEGYIKKQQARGNREQEISFPLTEKKFLQTLRPHDESLRLKKVELPGVAKSYRTFAHLFAEGFFPERRQSTFTVFVKHASALTFALLVAIGGGFLTLKETSPQRAASLAAATGASSQLASLLDGYRNLRNIAFGIPVEKKEMPQVATASPQTSAPVAISEPAPAPLINQTGDLKAELEAYVRTQIAELTHPAAPQTIYTTLSPVINTSEFRNEILLADTRPFVGHQSDAGADNLGLSLSKLQNNGTFTNPTLVGASLDNFIFTTATGTTLSLGTLATSYASFASASTSALSIDGTGQGLTFTGAGNHDITAANGTLRIGSNTILGNILPLDATINVGAPGTRFNKIYADEVNASTIVGTISGGNVSAESMRINSDNVTADAEDSFLEFERGTLNPNALLTWDSTNKRFTMNAPLALLGGIGNGDLLVTGSTTLQNLTFQNATGTSATTTNFFSSQGTITSATSTNLYTTNFLAMGSTTFQNITFINATGTAATTTNLFVSGLASTTNLRANTGIIGNILSALGTFTNLLVNGSSTFQNFSAQYASTTEIGSTQNAYFATSAGSVGIGTTTPTSVVTLASSVANSGLGTLRLSRSGTDKENFIRFDTLNNATNSWLIGNDDSTGSATNFEIIPSLGSPVLDITTSGNVGIGTSVPTNLQGGFTGLAGTVVQVQNSSNNAQVVMSAGGAGKVSALGFEVSDATAGKKFFQQLYEGANNILKFRVLNESNSAIAQDNILVLKNDGNVGIGTSTPNALLTLNDPAGVTSFYIGSSTPKLIVKDSGFVGIGTAAPAARLHILNTTGATAKFEDSNANGPLLKVSDGTTEFGFLGSQLAVEGSGNKDTFIVGSGNGKPLILRSAASQTVSIKQGATTSMSFDINSNAGIGITAPVGKLSLESSNTGDNIKYLTFHDYNAADIWDFKYSNTTGRLALDSSGPYPLTLNTTGGAVGIGMTNPDTYGATLGVHAGTNMNFSVRTLAGIGGSGTGIGLDSVTDNAGATQKMGLRASEFQILGGNVGIGETAPGKLLDVKANVAADYAARIHNTNATGVGLYLGVPVGGVPLYIYKEVAGAADTQILSITLNNASGAKTPIMQQPSLDTGNGTPGPQFLLGRNSNGTTAESGALDIVNNAGTQYSIWPDNAGQLRIHTAPPGDGVGDTAGTVVGAQSSALDTKNLAGEFTDYQSALATIVAAPLYNFTYKSGAFNGEQFTGIVTDFSPAFGMDRDAVHPAGKSLNVINAIGYTFAALKEIATIAGSFKDNLIAWLGNAQNGIQDLFANRVHTKELCVSDDSGETCVTRTQLNTLLASAGGQGSVGGGGGTGGTIEIIPPDTTASSTPDMATSTPPTDLTTSASSTPDIVPPPPSDASSTDTTTP